MKNCERTVGIEELFIGNCCSSFPRHGSLVLLNYIIVSNFFEHASMSLCVRYLEMHLLWCRTGICSWNGSVEGSLMLDDPFSVSFLCTLEYISLYFIQNSMQVIPSG